jgi:hypothetical protein
VRLGRASWACSQAFSCCSRSSGIVIVALFILRLYHQMVNLVQQHQTDSIRRRASMTTAQQVKLARMPPPTPAPPGYASVAWDAGGGRLAAGSGSGLGRRATGGGVRDRGSGGGRLAAGSGSGFGSTGKRRRHQPEPGTGRPPPAARCPDSRIHNPGICVLNRKFLGATFSSHPLYLL